MKEYYKILNLKENASNEEIENFYQSFALMLDSSQRKRLRAVVQRLKEI